MAETILDLNSDAMRKIILRLQILERDLIELGKRKKMALLKSNGIDPNSYAHQNTYGTSGNGSNPNGS